MVHKRVALITGAGRGIGRGIALELSKNGFALAGCDIIYAPRERKTGLFEVKAAVKGRAFGSPLARGLYPRASTAEVDPRAKPGAPAAVEKLGGEFLPLRGDIASLGDHETILRNVLWKFGRLDVLVNNAGVATEVRRDVLETTPESYDRVLSINARGAFFLTQRAAKEMITLVKKNPAAKPAIIFISSISAVVSSPARAEYCISKAALSMAAKVYADRLAEFGISVYEVRPGIIRTYMTEPVREKYAKLLAEGLVLQKRWGFPEDVGKAVAALAAGSFPYSTGLVLEVSGGMDIRRL